MPTNAEQAQTYYERGNELRDAGHIVQAMEEWKAATRLEPNHIEAHLNLGIAYADAGELDQAVQELDAAYRLDPYNEDAKREYVEALNERGTKASEQGDSARAVSDWKLALEIDPDNADAHFNLALNLVDQGDLASAEIHLRAAIKAEPYDLETRYELARVLMQLEREDAAIHELREALDIAARINSTLSSTGSTILPLDAQFDAEKMERHAPLLERASAHFDLIAHTLADLHIQRGEFEQAQGALEQAQFDKDSAPLWLKIGRAWIDQSRIDDAVLALRRAYDCDHDLTEARELLDQLGVPYEEPPEEEDAEAEN